MTLLDRFRTQTRHKHPDPAVRLAYVAEIPLDDRDLIAVIAREDEDPRVRRAAVGKLMDASALGSVARDAATATDAEPDVLVSTQDQGATLSRRHGTGECGVTAQALEGALAGRADRADRHPDRLRDLLVGELGPVDEQGQQLALAAGEAADRGAQLGAALALDRLLVGGRRRAGRLRHR